MGRQSYKRLYIIIPTGYYLRKQPLPRICRKYDSCLDDCNKKNCTHGGKHSPSHKCCGSIDLRNRMPDGKCDYPGTFYLREEDEKLKDMSMVQVKDISSVISSNVKTLEYTIQEYSEKILKYKEFQVNINKLISI